MEENIGDYIRMSNNTKDKEKELSNKIRADILITAQKKKEFESHAIKIVEFLIEGQLNPDAFIRCLKHINPELYQDVVEERSISNICGYPICGRKRPEMPKKLYHISAKSNKVYDISERKDYCSNFCYKASTYIKKQLDSSPLWLRGAEETRKLKLLPASAKGVPGELIDQGIAKTTLEPTFTSISNFAQMTLNEVNELEIKPKEETSEETKSEKRMKQNQSSMETILEEYPDEEPEVVGEELELSEEIEADYRISKLVASKKETSETNKQQNSISADTKSNINDFVKDNHNGKSKMNAPQDCIKENVDFAKVDVSSTSSHSEDPDKGYLQQKGVKQKNPKNIPRKPSLEELIAKHKEKQKLNTKAIKTLDFSELIANKHSENSHSVDTVNSKLPTDEKKSYYKKSKNLGHCYETKHENKISEDSDEQSLSRAKYDENLEKIMNCVKEWLTIETYIYLHGEEKIKHLLNEKKMHEYFENLKITELEISQQIKYMEICKRLQMKELAEEKFDRAIIDQKLQPLPDYQQLKEESKDMNLKVKSFYCGLVYEKDDPNFPSQSKSNDDRTEDEGGPPAVLPLLDASSQNALRRKVFLNSINKSLHTHVHELQMDASLVFVEVQALMKTFKLQARNVAFKPMFWNIIAILLIKIVSYRDSSFKAKLEENRSTQYLELVFEKCSGYQLFLEDVCKIIEDVNGFIENFITMIPND